MNRNLIRAIQIFGVLVLTFVASACTSSSPPAAAPAPTASNSITGIVWQWTSLTNQTTKQTTTVPKPENYTIVFNADGTLTGKADCNTFTGTYSQTNGFSIKLGATTLAACPEGSLASQYLTLLSSVAAGGPDGLGGLALETAGGEQRMMFKNGGPAPK
ncbi:MAG: META domain-containing protein [Anaerolineae bacterium]